ncbi:MAG: hypothetical protein ACP5RM_03500 [Candidatus Micrarchaeia archaeon]
MANIWSDYSDAIIKELDPTIEEKYGIRLSDLLSNPRALTSTQNASITIGNIKEEVDNYIEERRKDAAKYESNFDDMIERADAITVKIAQRISTIAKQNNVPLVKPVAIDRDTTKEEQIFVDAGSDDVLALVEKLVAASMLVADFTTQYKNFKIGQWFFSGHKNYTLNVYMPASNIMMLDSSKEELDTLLDAASDFMSGA